jgi:two-component system sensor kinase FixL
MAKNRREGFQEQGVMSESARTPHSIDDLSTSRAERTAAIVFAAILVGLALTSWRFVGMPAPGINGPAFFTAYDILSVCLAWMTGFLLISQFRQAPQIALLCLAIGYLLAGGAAIVHLLSIPGLLLQARLFGNDNSALWARIFWLVAVAAGALAYVATRSLPPSRRASSAIVAGLAVALTLVALVAFLAGPAIEWLPDLTPKPENFANTYLVLLPAVMAVQLVALACLWRSTRLASVLPLWLFLAVLAALVETTIGWLLLGVLPDRRYSLNFYIARFAGMASGSLLLMALLNEVAAVYQRLARSHQELELRVEERTWDLRRRTEALRESEERYEHLANATQEGVVICDRSRIIEANSGFLRMFGYSKAQMADRPFDQFFPAETREDVALRMQAADGASHETIGLRRDGSGFPIDLSASRIKYGGRDVRVAVMRDLTEDKRAEELRAELLHTSRVSEIGQMAAALAHEVNQPITAVSSYLGGCRRIMETAGFDEHRKEKVREAVEMANSQALRAGEIIRRLREFMRKGETDRTIESAAAVMREASTLAVAVARHNGIIIRLDVDKPGDVLVDKIQIQQVIVNLVRNAIEAMENCPRKELGIRLATNCEQIELSVSDTGSGLSPDIADRLFRPFSSTKRQGMGIGLSVCRDIVEAHDGRIWAEPNPCGGTIFRFSLPLVREEMID